MRYEVLATVLSKSKLFLDNASCKFVNTYSSADFLICPADGDGEVSEEYTNIDCI
jgi:hypothetical protein